jgi:hypothetical protein
MSDAKTIVANFFDKLCSGDFPGGFDSLAEDATWSIIGTTPFSKTFTKDTLLSDMIPELATFPEAPQMKVKYIIAEGDKAAVIASVKGVAKYGPYEQDPYCFVVTTRDGKVAEIIEFLDTAAVETAMCGSKILPR